jgi:photosystem II stability/assembly factor-like uncharacterized protein
MTEKWRRLGPIAWGGSVLSVQANAAGEIWAATAGGLLARGEDGWRPVSGGPAQPGLVAAPGINWWVAGLNGGLSSTYNGGRTWWEPFYDGLDVPITCIAASPRWATDRVMLAGTSGAGVLRTIDGGRRWLGANFGLRDYAVLALAAATDWTRREVILAGTLDGVYRSAGGGRAWKAAGMAGLAVQALAASTGAAEGGVVLAGTESAGLFRSADGGFTWEPAGDVMGREVSVNALLRLGASAGEVFIAATDAGDLWRSEDAGLTWSKVNENGDPILALAATHDFGQVLAGASEQGVLLSQDDGRSWTPDETLCAWGFRRLLSPDERTLLAWSPTGGVWRSTDGGANWERIAAASHYEPVFAYLTVRDGALEARTEALVLRQGEDETLVLEAGDTPIIALAADRERSAIWAADLVANIAVSRDGGRSWSQDDVPWSGQQFLTLGVADDASGIPIAATHNAEAGTVTVWRRPEDGWERWLERPARWAGAALAPAKALGEQTWVVIAGEAWSFSEAAGWEQVVTPEDAGVVVAVAQTGGVRSLIAGRTVLRAAQGGEWQSFALPEAIAGPVDLLNLVDGSTLLLDAVGTIWRLES